jgi:hypothetical protein
MDHRHHVDQMTQEAAGDPHPVRAAREARFASRAPLPSHCDRWCSNW